MDTSDKQIDAIAAHLARELGNCTTAVSCARLLAEDVLSWRASEVPASHVATILAFTFGNGMQPNGNGTPGRSTKRLNNIAVSLHRATGAPVYAQWEVAEAAGDLVPDDRLFAKFPSRNERSKPRCLSTTGVVAGSLWAPLSSRRLLDLRCSGSDAPVVTSYRLTPYPAENARTVTRAPSRESGFVLGQEEPFPMQGLSGRGVDLTRSHKDMPTAGIAIT